MRSRYSAYALGDVEYLIATHLDDQTSLGQRRCALKATCRQTQWLGLEILAREGGGVNDGEGTVRFVAHFRTDGQRSTLQETSLFQRRGADRRGEWLYIRAK